MRGRWTWGGAGLLAVLAACAVWGGPVHAQNIPTFDANSARSRTVTSSVYTSTYLNKAPFYATLPKNPDGEAWQSYSTPVVVGGNAYQYAFDSSGHAVLWTFPMTQPSAACWSGGGTCSIAWTPSQTFTWDPGWLDGPYGWYNLAAEPTGPTLAQGYTAIGIGKFLYSWPTGASSTGTSHFIVGNPGQDIYQVAMSPLITPPVTVYGRNSSFVATNWISPVAVVGSWDGGVLAYPTYVPSGDYAVPVSYRTSMDYGHNGAFVTSSPTWIPALGEVAFGISTPGYPPTFHPRVILMNPATGAHSIIGSGIIRASVDSSIALGPNGNLYVPDQQGGLYEFTTSGHLVAEQQALSSSSFDISNLAVSPHAVYAVGKGLSELASLNPSTLAVNWINNKLGTGLYSPSVVNNGTSDQIFVQSSQHGTLWALKQNGTVTQGLGSPTPAYVSAIADAGPNHWVMTWTNFDPAGQPALEAWPTAAYNVTANLSQTTVSPGQSVTLSAYATPTDGSDPSDITKSVTAGIPNANGQGSTTFTVPQNTPTTWSGSFNAPTTPGTWTIPITATSFPNMGFSQNTSLTATTSVTLTVVCTTPKPPSNPQGTLTLQAYSLPNHGDPEPPGDAKLGDRIDAQLSVTASQVAPTCVKNPQVTGVYFTQATLNHPNGVDNFTSQSSWNILTAQEPMLIHGATATAHFLENWSGFPPPVPPATTTWQGSVSADWTAHVTFTYQVPSGQSGGTTTWKTVSGSYNLQGTATAPLSVTGTDWYVIPVPVQGSDQYN